ncbi:MAG: glycosyltransferase [Terracidiphilus sp.]
MLTVLLATRNRGRMLREVLEAYRRLQKPSGGWKVVVVDNGSTDETADVLASFKGILPLDAISEPRSGKNQALNTGLKLVEGDLTVFTDDDVFPSEDWLVQLREAADAHPLFSIFGGSVVPRWEVAPPAWIHRVIVTIPPPGKTYEVWSGPVYTLTDQSIQGGPVVPGLVYGPNMAIRTSILQSGVSFDEAIGPRGSSYPMGSETEILLRLSRQGNRAWYVKEAIVEHFIRKEQLQKSWVLRRAVRYGRGQHRLGPNKNLWMGIPRRLFRDIPKEAFLMARASLVFRPDDLFRAHWRFNFLRGQAYEALMIARARRAEHKMKKEIADQPRPAPSA